MFYIKSGPPQPKEFHVQHNGLFIQIFYEYIYTLFDNEVKGSSPLDDEIKLILVKFNSDIIDIDEVEFDDYRLYVNHYKLAEKHYPRIRGLKIEEDVWNQMIPFLYHNYPNDLSETERITYEIENKCMQPNMNTLIQLLKMDKKFLLNFNPSEDLIYEYLIKYNRNHTMLAHFLNSYEIEKHGYYPDWFIIKNLNSENINNTDSKGNTVLHLDKRFHVQMCAIKEGCDKSIKNNLGKTAYDIHGQEYLKPDLKKARCW